MPRRIAWIAGSILLLLLLAAVASELLEEPLRRRTEREMNQKLTGYTVRLPVLDLSLLRFSVVFRGLTVRQQANPEPPVVMIPRLRAGVQWRELLSLRLVADFLLDRPRVYVNLKQLRQESKDKTPIKDRGWQHALQAVYPLKINLLRIVDGDLTYLDEDPRRPLRVRHLNFRANNIRNIHSPEHAYPSPIHADAVLFEQGRGTLDGHANFLAEPFPGVHVLFKLEKVPFDPFRPAAGRANLIVRKGTLSAAGRTEYAPGTRVVHVTDLTIAGLSLDYVHSPRTAEAEKARVEKVKSAVARGSKKPGVLLRLDRFQLVDSEIGFVNRAKDPPYRVFLRDTDLDVTNLSNRFRRGPAKARLRARFMGSGATAASASFRPERNGPDFDLDLAIRATRLTAMNDLLRSHAKVDVVDGFFSLYSEIRVKDGAIRGYVKPLFRDVDAYDPQQDKEDNIFRKIWEGIVGGVSKLLENEPRDEVATKVELSGRVEDPHSSTWQIIVRLVENAFFKAILPGFEKKLSRGGR